MNKKNWKQIYLSYDESYQPMAMLQKWWDKITPRHEFNATCTRDFNNWRRGLTTKIRTKFGVPQQEIKLVPTIVDKGVWEPGINYRMGTVKTALGMTIPFILLIPENAKNAAGILCVHGHGDGMNPMVGIDGAGNPTEDYHHHFPVVAARRGFVTLSFDLLGFGRRRDIDFLNKYPGTNPCDTPTKWAIHIGTSMAGLRLYDAIQMVTLLSSQPEVNPEKIGLSGISGGGLVALFLAALDKRVKAVNVSGYMNKYNSFMQVPHCIDNFMPDAANIADLPDIGCSIAPRPLLINQGLRDSIFPIQATREAVNIIRQAYNIFNAEERLEEEYYDTDHEYSNARVWDFMEYWLNKEI
jgi:hypothetical protein